MYINIEKPHVRSIRPAYNSSVLIIAGESHTQARVLCYTAVGVLVSLLPSHNDVCACLRL